MRLYNKDQVQGASLGNKIGERAVTSGALILSCVPSVLCTGAPRNGCLLMLQEETIVDAEHLAKLLCRARANGPLPVFHVREMGFGDSAPLGEMF